MTRDDRLDGVRFDRAVSAWCDGALDATTADELAARIAADPDLRRRYLAWVEVHALLHWHGARGGLLDADASLGRERGVPWTAIAMAATVLVAVLLTPWFRAADPDRPVLTRSVGAVWHGAAIEPGQPLPPGAVLRLAFGLAEVRSPDGSTLVLDGPGELGWDAAGAPSLRAGRAAVVGAAAGSRVVTPDATIAVGTAELGLVVGDGGTEVDARSAGPTVTPRRGVRVPMAGREWLRLEDGRVAARGSPPRDHRVLRPLPEVTGAAERALEAPGAVTWSGPFGAAGSWHDAAGWRSAALPGPDASVRVSRAATVTVTRDAVAGEVFVGHATLRVTAGHLDVARFVDLGLHRPGTALVVDGGRLTIAGRLVVRRSTALRLERGAVEVGDAVLLLDPGARWTVTTSATLTAPAVLGMRDGVETAVVVDAAFAARPLVRVSSGLELGGTLSLAFPAGEATPRRDVVLFAVTGDAPLFGGFTDRRDGDVVFRWSDGGRLIYRRGVACGPGPTNDVALVFDP